MEPQQPLPNRPPKRQPTLAGQLNHIGPFGLLLCGYNSFLESDHFNQPMVALLAFAFPATGIVIGTMIGVHFVRDVGRRFISPGWALVAAITTYMIYFGTSIVLDSLYLSFFLETSISLMVAAAWFCAIMVIRHSEEH